MTEAGETRRGRTIRSVEISFAILDALQDRGRIGVTELANELGHSKSTVHSHLRTLEEQNIVIREDDGYRLTLRILDMASHVREQVGNYDGITDEVDKLAEETGEIAQFGIEEHGNVSYLYKATGDQAVETRSRAGKQQPMHSTALGKAILAHLPPQRTEEILQSTAFERRTPETITTVEGVYDRLDDVVDRGYAIDDEENIQGLRCVSAPVRNGDAVLGAVSITGPSSRFTHERIHGELAEYAKSAANVIELNTKFSQ